MLPSTQSRHLLKPLTACLAAAFAAAAPQAIAATTWTVNSCSETNSGSGTTGTLRYAVANATSGDVVDMTTLACSTISLATGAITIGQPNLTLNGPGIGVLTITRNPAGVQDRIVTHNGTGGLLTINNLSITSGYFFPYGDANGGCIYSKSSISLDHVRVASCTAKTNYYARGGGIYTKINLAMANSSLDANSVMSISGSGTLVEGGGAYVFNDFSASYSTISNNQVVAFVGTTGFGGGLHVHGNVTISNSTISGNSASRSAGAMRISSPTPARVDIIDSTISGNSATNNIVGGILSTAGTVHLYNSTIAFNTASSAVVSGNHYSPGLALRPTASGTIVATLQSSVLANNTYMTTEDDLSTAGAGPNTTTFAGTNNLVPAHHFSANTTGNPITLTSDPLLAGLANNGGPTKTHALLTGSPAIGTGNNTAGLSFDQRGAGFARTTAAGTDIGAVQIQVNDTIFADGFQ